MPGATKGHEKRWQTMVGLARGCFSAPTYAIFSTLLTGWVLAPGRRPITQMICAADPEGQRAHDAYHRFVRAARWSTSALWKVLVVHMVGVLAPASTLVLDCDDTLYKKSDRRVEGAGSFRDAVRSTRNRVVYATGLNLVVVTLRVRPPWEASRSVSPSASVCTEREDRPPSISPRRSRSRSPRGCRSVPFRCALTVPTRRWRDVSFPARR